MLKRAELHPSRKKQERRRRLQSRGANWVFSMSVRCTGAGQFRQKSLNAITLKSRRTTRTFLTSTRKRAGNWRRETLKPSSMCLKISMHRLKTTTCRTFPRVKSKNGRHRWLPSIMKNSTKRTVSLMRYGGSLEWWLSRRRNFKISWSRCRRDQQLTSFRTPTSSCRPTLLTYILSWKATSMS